MRPVGPALVPVEQRSSHHPHEERDAQAAQVVAVAQGALGVTTSCAGTTPLSVSAPRGTRRTR